MKKTILPTLLLLSSFCFSQKITVTKLQPHPIFSPSTEVALFFPYEPWPDEPFAKLAIISCQGNLEIGQALTEMTRHAKHHGYDALILFRDDRTSLGGEVGGIVSTLAGVGVKYRKNLQTPVILGYRFSENRNQQGWKNAGTVKLGDQATGEQVQTEPIFWELIHFFALPELIRQPLRWESNYYPNGKMRTKAHQHDRETNLFYDEQGHLVTGSVKRKGKSDCDLTFEMDKNGRITEQFVDTAPNFGSLTFRYAYDEAGLLQKITVTQVSTKLDFLHVEPQYSTWEEDVD